MNEDNVRAPIQLRTERQSQELKRYFFSKPDPSIFTSIAPELSDLSNKTSSDFQALKLTS